MVERRLLIRPGRSVTRASPCRSIERGSDGYPAELERRLRTEAPEGLQTWGNLALLDAPLLGIFASIRTPPGLVLKGLDCARILRQEGPNVIGGFQSPLEREMLRMLLRGNGGVIVCSARRVEGMRIPRGWRETMESGRMLLAGTSGNRWRRATVRSATHRNRLVTALASSILVIHAHPGSRTYRTVSEAIEWGKPVFCLAHPANRDLEVLGAQPIESLQSLTRELSVTSAEG